MILNHITAYRLHAMLYYSNFSKFHWPITAFSALRTWGCGTDGSKWYPDEVISVFDENHTRLGQVFGENHTRSDKI